MKLNVLLFGLLVISANAAPYAVELKFESLTLRNGQKLENGVIKSYDHANGKVVIQANRQITSVQIELLPEQLSEKVISMVPEQVKDAAREENAERKQERKTAAQELAAQNARKKQVADARLRANAENQARVDQSIQSSAKESVRYQAKSLARTRADRYYSYELKPGSGYSVVYSSSIQLNEPEEVPGWDRRYRVSGTVGLNYYDSSGRNFQSTTARFEVVVGPDSNGNIVALDFTAK